MTTPRHTLTPGAPPALRLPRAPTLRSRSASGDAAAFAALYQRHHQELYRYCRAILRHDEDAQDALQSAMAKAYAALQKETRDFEMRPWLFRIAHNEAISVMRRRQQATNLDAAPEIAVDSLPGTLSDRQRLSELRADLADLPERQRAALVLRELSGLGHEDIAQVLSSSASAVKQSIFEARTGLAECAEGREMACGTVQRALSDADGRVLRGRRIRAHLRACRACREFRAAMQTRPADLRALASPLPAGAGAAVLAAVLPGGSATVAGGAGTAATGGGVAAGVAGAGSATAGPALAGAGSVAMGGAFAGLATKAAIVATIGAAAVGAAKLDGSARAPHPAERAPIAQSAQGPLARASLGAAPIARRSGGPAPATAGHAGAAVPAVAPGRSRSPRAKRASHPSRRSAAAREGRRQAATARTRGSTHSTRRARHARPAHAAQPARAARPAPPARPARPPRVAPVRRQRPTTPRSVAPPSARRPAPKPAPAHRASPSRRSGAAPGPPASAATPAPANPGHAGSQPAAGHAK